MAEETKEKEMSEFVKNWEFPFADKPADEPAPKYRISVEVTVPITWREKYLEDEK